MEGVDLGAAIDNFYPRPPRGGRPASALPAGVPASISIHALREEGDFDNPDFVY